LESNIGEPFSIGESGEFTHCVSATSATANAIQSDYVQQLGEVFQESEQYAAERLNNFERP